VGCRSAVGSIPNDRISPTATTPATRYHGFFAPKKIILCIIRFPRPKGRGKEIREIAKQVYLAKRSVFNSPALIGLRITRIYQFVCTLPQCRGGSSECRAIHPSLKTRPFPKWGVGATTAGGCAIYKGRYAMPTTRPYNPMRYV
jgi:hypothetical protein